MNKRRITSVTLSQIALGASRVALQTSAVVTRRAGAHQNVHDISTAVDRAISEYVAAELFRLYPEIPEVGEEHAPGFSTLLSLPGVFIVDEADGSSNVKWDFGSWAISIAYAENGMSVSGAIWTPAFYRSLGGRLFHATEGQGAFYTDINEHGLATLDPVRLAPPVVTDLSKATVAFESSYDLDDALALLGGIHRLGKTASVKNIGSQVLQLAMTAMGMRQLMVSNTMKPWDQAAGVILAREAGLVAVDFGSGKAANVLSQNLLVGHQALVAQALPVFHELA